MTQGTGGGHPQQPVLTEITSNDNFPGIQTCTSKESDNSSITPEDLATFGLSEDYTATQMKQSEQAEANQKLVEGNWKGLDSDLQYEPPAETEYVST